MSCDPMSFRNVNRQVFDGLKSKLESIGYSLEGIKGTIKGPMGIVIDYNWDENAATLFTHVKAKNFLVPCGRINAELEKAIESCR